MKSAENPIKTAAAASSTLIVQFRKSTFLLLFSKNFLVNLLMFQHILLLIKCEPIIEKTEILHHILFIHAPVNLLIYL